MGFLEALNTALEPLEATFTVPDDPVAPVFITGVPRAGTTVVNQLLAAVADVGYVSNVMARFWRAPAVGARLSLEVMGKRGFSGESDHGQTAGPDEPHEFGAFWRHHLGYDGMEQKADDDGIDWDALLQALGRVAKVFDRPVVYKVFHLVWHVQEFQRRWPSARWIWVRRDPVENALSLLRLREQRTGSRHEWVSAKPRGAGRFDGREPEIQVAAQVVLMEHEIGRRLAVLPPPPAAEVWLEDLWRNPADEMQRIASEVGLSLDREALGTIIDRVRGGASVPSEDPTRQKIERALQEVRDTI